MRLSTYFILSCLLFTQVALAQKVPSPEGKKNPPKVSQENASEPKPKPKPKPLDLLETKVQGEKVQVQFVRKEGFEDKKYDEWFGKFRIYRKKIDFALAKNKGKLRKSGLVCKDADLIYEGPIKPQGNPSAVYRYTDEDVSVNQSYVYWAAAAEGEPVGPCPVKVRNQQACWPIEKVAAEMHDLQKKYPGLVKVTVVGKTTKGKEMLGIEVGKSKNKIALIGYVHAAESGAELILPMIRSLLENHKDLFDKMSLVAIPVVNVDQKQKYAQGNPWYLRTNAAGVDLNRNFPANWETISYKYHGDTSDPKCSTYRGPSPSSEPETRAVMSFLKQHRPIAVLSFHCVASVTGRCFLMPNVPPEAEAFKQRCQKIHELYSQGYCAGFPDERYEKEKKEKPGKHLVQSEIPGTVGAWCYQELGIPGFDLELHNYKKHYYLHKLFTDDTDRETLKRNQQQHTAALLKLLKNLKTLQEGKAAAQ